MNWLLYGLRGGVLSTRYPHRPDAMPMQYRGSIEALTADIGERRTGEQACLSGAIRADRSEAASIDRLRCFQCGECARRSPGAFRMSNRFEVAEVENDPGLARELLAKRTRALGRSIHVRHVDAGSDGSEEQELQAIFNPFYDANRLGIFLTATPRHADLLAVTGVVTQPMLDPLLFAYEAMPEPKIVVALGTTACSGGIFADGPGIVGPVGAVLPVDVFVPGSPPSPLSILHGFWVALGRALGGERSS